MKSSGGYVLLIVFRSVLVVGVLLLANCARLPKEYDPQEGDILIQSFELNPLVVAIEGVTESPYSHCGIVTERADGWYVLEAIGPVKETPILEWIGQGRGKRFWAYRLDDSFQVSVPEIIGMARKHKGKGYDADYLFDNEEIYCSELVFLAIHDATGRQVGKIEKLGDLNWKPYEKNIINLHGYVPHERGLITPASLAAAPELNLVYPKE
jgi:hypothetical protein